MSDTQYSEVPDDVAELPSSEKEESMWRNVLIFCGILTLISMIYLISSLARVTDYLVNLNELEVASANIVKDVNDVSFSRDFEVSSQAYKRLQNNVTIYETALAKLGQSGLGKSVADELNKDWQTKKEQANFVLNNENSLNALQDSQTNVANGVKKIQEDYAQAIEQAIVRRIPAEHIGQMQAQILRAERMANSMNNLAASTMTSSDDFKKEVTEFGQALDAQITSLGQNVPAMLLVQETYNNLIAPEFQNLQSLATPAAQARESAQALSDIGTVTQSRLSNTDRNILSNYHVLIPALGILFGILGLILAFWRLIRLRRSDTASMALGSRERMNYEHEIKRLKSQLDFKDKDSERSSGAMLRLLDELGELANGDLTVNATVSEDFTGAIADSVNYAIDQLRQIVQAINVTSERVAESSQQTQMTAVKLAESSEDQAQQIASVSAAINEMAVSIDQVSANALESASVANRSVAIAHNGAEVVQRSIDGMGIIRDQIQETSKRIKRLGESSQEIGDIVGLINDIADQTNILALNAAIQASMAGEAGRGFAVVADEVQRLAERSATATRQIENLVKTIQADTNEAVASMESTTTEVVRGAKMAKDAGVALEEVQDVSHKLSDLIQNISNAASQQAKSAGHISSTMNLIQDITSQTASGTMATARSVGHLNEMAAELQKSVSGFKLPEDDGFYQDHHHDSDGFKY